MPKSQEPDAGHAVGNQEQEKTSTDRNWLAKWQQQCNSRKDQSNGAQQYGSCYSDQCLPIEKPMANLKSESQYEDSSAAENASQADAGVLLGVGV